MYQHSELPLIDGVDMEKGVVRWKNPDTYLKELAGFASDYHDIVYKLSGFIDEHKYDDILYASHTLQGTAGNLEIVKVSKIAEKLILLADKKEDKAILKEIDRLERAMDRFLSSIQKQTCRETANDVKPKKEIELNELKIHLINLLDAYELYDPNKVEPHINKINDYFSDKELEKINYFVNQLDFESAKAETIRFSKQFNIDLMDK